jgi:hypothetical protein
MKILWTCNKSSTDFNVQLRIITTGTPSSSEEIVFKCIVFSGGILRVVVFGVYDIGVMPSAGGVLLR